MDRKEFLDTLVRMYPNSFNQGNLQIWMNGYKKVLSENLNFEVLFEKLITEYMSIHTAPAPAWFKEYTTLPSVKPEKKKVVEVIKGDPPPQSYLDLKKKLQQSTNAKSEILAS